MSITSSKRSAMTLYSGDTDPYSHRVRIVLAEKCVNCDIVDVPSNTQARQELMEHNPYGGYPTLLDRELVVYRSDIIVEYLDERFPHPPLMPIYPVAKARTRLMLYRMNKDWYSLLDILLSAKENPDQDMSKTKQELIDSLVSVVPVIVEMPYFLSEEFSLMDCYLAPILWRLPSLGIQLPQQAKPLLQYGEKLFARESFKQSLTDAEKKLHN